MPMDHFIAEFRDRAGNDNPSFLHHGKAVGCLARKRDILLDQYDGETDIPIKAVSYTHLTLPTIYSV